MINKINTAPAKLIVYIRDGLIEQEHFGYIIKANKNRIIEQVGEDKNYPFFLRSCAKPLQAALMIDYGLDSVLQKKKLLYVQLHMPVRRFMWNLSKIF